ncbi:hypothetical protein QNI19_33030 [Cytophagaceae bacterium DM2B3-1]|uniref:Uncharacterized protein n=1 Tax=Xanthocytophaga flava TaxID=3048013 RepID=A0ABT7CY13_9BACT|nr:hypothetical protein [Xanthocytophaga flavus]MDJ1497812.1 hypothetical protein [Xanthocytophaga flavus]
MISNKDLYLEEYYQNGAEIAMYQEFEAWQAWEALLKWADDRIRQSESFFLDLRDDSLEPVEIAPEDEVISEEMNWFMRGDSVSQEGKSIRFLPENTGWRIPA